MGAPKALTMPVSPDMVRRWLRPISLPPDAEERVAGWLSGLSDEWARGHPRVRLTDSEARGRRIADALDVLAAELPVFIDDNNHCRNRVLFGTCGNPPTEPRTVLDQLLYAVDRVRPGLAPYAEHASSEVWHDLAQHINHIVSADLAAQRCPAKLRIAVVQAALGAMGVEATANAVRKALK